MKGKMAQYPPATAANQPSSTIGDRWYERGYGPRWMTKGGIKGKRTSETLGRKWTSRYDRNTFTATVGNNVSYGPFVMGTKDEQARHMKKIGWKGIDVVAAAETKRITEYVVDAVRRSLEG